MMDIIQKAPSSIIILISIAVLVISFRVLNSIIPRNLTAPARSFIWRLHHDATASLAAWRWGPVWEHGEAAHKYHVITSKTNMQELSEHPNLSQRAVYADLFGFKYSLSQFDHNEEKTARTRLFGRVLHEQKARLQDLEPIVKKRLQDVLPDFLADWHWTGNSYAVQTAPTFRKLAGTLMCDLLLGPTLANETELREALLQHPRDMIAFAKAYQVCPRFLAPLVYNLVTHEGEAMKRIMKRLIPVAAREDGSWAASEEEKDLSILGKMISATYGNEYWTPHRIVQALTGIWFAASHQPWTILDFVLIELCDRPEYISFIRDEIEAAGQLDFNKLEQLPVLNSFIKETVRWNPSDQLNIRRKVMRPMKFKNDGPALDADDIVCVSQYKLMKESDRYNHGEEFDGLRFARGGPWPAGSPKDMASKFTEVASDFTAWGFGSLACPGRFQANFVIKLCLAEIIKNYDFEYEERTQPTAWHWNTFRVPYETTRVLFSKRLSDHPENSTLIPT